MISDSMLRTNLERFLERNGAGGRDLLSDIDGGLGEPLLVVASGSVLQGFGNPSSDVDLYVVVANDAVTDAPTYTWGGGVHLDINFLKASWLTEQLAVLSEGTGAICVVADRAEWKTEYRRLDQLSRLATGLALTGEPEWLRWQQTVRELLPDRAIAWWRGEALRFSIAAQLLKDINGLLSAQRYCDAYLNALNAYCAEQGELYIVEKWAGSKLRRLGSAELLERFHQVLLTPGRLADVPRYIERVSRWFDELVADWTVPSPEVTLWPADGVEIWQSNGTVLVHRYALRGVEFPDTGTDSAPTLPWTGKPDEITEGMRLLIKEGLVWMSMTEERR